MSKATENDIAYRLRLWRKDTLGLTQEQFATETGVHVSMIRKYEKQISVPSGESLLGIAKTGVNLHWLLTGEGNMYARRRDTDFGINDGIPNDAPPCLSTARDLLMQMDEAARKTILTEICARIQEAKRVADLEKLVREMAQKLD